MVKFPQIETPPNLEVPYDRAGSNRSHWRGLHPPQVLTPLRPLKQLSIITAFQIASLASQMANPIPCRLHNTYKPPTPKKNANPLNFLKNLIYVRGAWWEEGVDNAEGIQFRISTPFPPPFLTKSSDSESRRRLIRLMTACHGEISPERNPTQPRSSL
jgi:hypothetical protein